ncbi:aldo/keto reductase [Saccharopolyspora sp. K220]|uniref:aldo/keto reductase n=1 Tax=Saccharopolyspora soli TaxID=2926618 RepID=UPI001F5645C5|nr:aldo/keto reductase [Saccharopolyspora soli]MCI2420599.1 aldo/keto reductase [Saccharopolyspora soli]
MKFSQLGNTGVYVSRIALGTMTFGGSGAPPWNIIGALDVAAADRLVGIALDQGVNLVDTADMYADGEAESMLGEILKSRRDDVLLATKVIGRMGPGPNDAGLSRLHVTKALEDSLRRLRTDHIDLYQLHNFDPVTPIAETLSALDDAVRQGKVRYIGVSNFAAWQMSQALGVSDLRNFPRFVASQSYYSLVGRDIEAEIVPMLTAEQLGLLVYSPLAGGLLSGKFDRSGTTDEDARRAKAAIPPVDVDRAFDIIDALREIAGRHDATVAQVALAWVLAKPAVTSVIVGARRPEQLTGNLGALDTELTAQDLEELDGLSRPAPTYPGWMQADLSWRYPA